MEFVGLALSAAAMAEPLLRACISFYDLIQSVKTLNKVFENFARRVQIQRIQFEFCTRSLLLGTVDDNDLLKLLKHPSDKTISLESRGGGLDSRLREQMGDDYFEQFRNAIFSVYERLIEIAEELKPVLDSASPRGTVKMKLHTKAKFAFKKKPLQKLLQRLQEGNDDLMVLVDCKLQVQEQASWKEREQRLDTPLTGTRKALKKYSLIHAAAEDLAACLFARNSCKPHRSALRLPEPQNLASLKVVKNASVEMSYVFDYVYEILPAKPGCSSKATYLQLSVQSIPRPPSGDRLHWAQPAHSATRKRPRMQNGGKTTKRSKTSAKAPRRKNDDEEPEVSGENPPAEGCICSFFSTQNSPQRLHASSSSTNFLQSTPKHTYKFVTKPPVAAATFGTPLSSILETLGRGIELSERIKLAYQLSLTLLQFHSTHFLPPSWRSTNISLFPELSPATPDSQLHNPYLLPSSDAKISLASLSIEHEPPVEYSPLRHIPELYGLGLILLELGRGKLLVDSAVGRQPPSGLKEGMMEHLMACEHLAAVGRDVGAAYERAVRVCIYCDLEFGLKGKTVGGLQSLEARESFWRKVVVPLEECWRLFNE